MARGRDGGIARKRGLGGAERVVTCTCHVRARIEVDGGHLEVGDLGVARRVADVVDDGARVHPRHRRGALVVRVHLADRQVAAGKDVPQPLGRIEAHRLVDDDVAARVEALGDGGVGARVLDVLRVGLVPRAPVGARARLPNLLALLGEHLALGVGGDDLLAHDEIDAELLHHRVDALVRAVDTWQPAARLRVHVDALLGEVGLEISRELDPDEPRTDDGERVDLAHALLLRSEGGLAVLNARALGLDVRLVARARREHLPRGTAGW